MTPEQHYAAVLAAAQKLTAIDAEREQARNELAAAIRAALDAEPPGYEQPISVAKLARHLGVSRSAINKRLQRSVS